MISPSSPSVHVTSVTRAPSAAYLAIVAPVLIDSSSGCACTSSRLRSTPYPSVVRRVVPGHDRTLGRQRLVWPGMIESMTESFPRQQARTRGFRLGVPRAFQVSPDGARITFLRSKAGDDPVTCLWEADAATGEARLVADPRTLGADEENLPAEERARRERVRETAAGIVAYATDRAATLAAFALSGQV